MFGTATSAAFKEGDHVNIHGTDYRNVVIAEDRGLLGPGRTRVYRIVFREEPWYEYIEVREDQLERAAP